MATDHKRPTPIAAKTCRILLLVILPTSVWIEITRIGRASLLTPKILYNCYFLQSDRALPQKVAGLTSFVLVRVISWIVLSFYGRKKTIHEVKRTKRETRYPTNSTFGAKLTTLGTRAESGTYLVAIGDELDCSPPRRATCPLREKLIDSPRIRVAS